MHPCYIYPSSGDNCILKIYILTIASLGAPTSTHLLTYGIRIPLVSAVCSSPPIILRSPSFNPYPEVYSAQSSEPASPWLPRCPPTDHKSLLQPRLADIFLLLSSITLRFLTSLLFPIATTPIRLSSELNFIPLVNGTRTIVVLYISPKLYLIK